MVAKAVGYFGHPLKVNKCVTQGNPLSPTIFNMVMDAVILHWVTVVMPTEEDTVGLGLEIINLGAYFCYDNGLMALTQPESLWRAFDVLAVLFDRFGLRKNMAKTVVMLCQPCHAPGGVSEEAYKRRTTGKRPIFQERQRRMVECPECRVKVAAFLLLTHRHIQHGVRRWDRGGHHPPPPSLRYAQAYRVSFPEHMSRLR